MTGHQWVWLTASIVVQAVLVVDTSLKMSIGKTAAQCAHAAVGVFKGMHINAVPWLQAWEVSMPDWGSSQHADADDANCTTAYQGAAVQEEGEKTVVLKASSSAELEELEAKAQTLLLPTFLVPESIHCNCVLDSYR